MTTSESTSPTQQEIERDIERTRQELGETVEALTAKMDVKTRTKQRLASTRDRARTKLDEVGPVVPAGVAAAVVVAVVAVIVWRRRR